MFIIGFFGFLFGWLCFSLGIQNELEQALPWGNTTYSIPVALEASIQAEAFALGAWYSFFVFGWITIGIIILFFILAIIDAIKRVK